jgi:hypothetical protein
LEARLPLQQLKVLLLNLTPDNKFRASSPALVPTLIRSSLALPTLRFVLFGRLTNAQSTEDKSEAAAVGHQIGTWFAGVYISFSPTHKH